MPWISGLVQDKQNKSTTTEDDPFDVNEVIDNDRVIEEGDIDESEDDDSEDLAIDTETEVEEPSNSRYKVFNHLYVPKYVSNALLFWWEERDKIIVGSLKFYTSHLSKRPSDLKQNGTQEKKTFSGPLFHAL